MNYPKEIWVDTDLVGDDEPHENWQKYVLVGEPVVTSKNGAYGVQNGETILAAVAKI